MDDDGDADHDCGGGRGAVVVRLLFAPVLWQTPGCASAGKLVHLDSSGEQDTLSHQHISLGHCFRLGLLQPFDIRSQYSHLQIHT